MKINGKQYPDELVQLALARCSYHMRRHRPLDDEYDDFREAGLDPDGHSVRYVVGALLDDLRAHLGSGAARSR